MASVQMYQFALNAYRDCGEKKISNPLGALGAEGHEGLSHSPILCYFRELGSKNA